MPSASCSSTRLPVEEREPAAWQLAVILVAALDRILEKNVTFPAYPRTSLRWTVVMAEPVNAREEITAREPGEQLMYAVQVAFLPRSMSMRFSL